MARGFVIGVIGAAGTGRTTLVRELGAALDDGTQRVAIVADALREFCERHRRVPRIAEHARIAQEQARRIAAAAARHHIVVADSTPLTVAVDLDRAFGDPGLYDSVYGGPARCDLSLLTALDLPWQADGSPARERVDALLRAALRRVSAPYSVVTGSGAQRLDNALRAVQRARPNPGETDAVEARRPWSWACERCSDAACERHLLPPIDRR